MAPASAVVVRQPGERSTDPETPLEREEALARSTVSRSASKIPGKPRRARLSEALTIITTIAQPVSMQALLLASSASSAPHLRQHHGVLRI